MAVRNIISSVYFLQAGLPDDLSENPLDNAELLQDQLDCFPYLCRFQVSYIFYIIVILFLRKEEIYLQVRTTSAGFLRTV